MLKIRKMDRIWGMRLSIRMNNHIRLLIVNEWIDNRSSIHLGCLEIFALSLGR